MAELRCPTCNKRFEMSESKSLPFCSDRCRKVDLGRWMREVYSVSVPKSEDDEESELDESADPRRRRRDDDE